MTEQQARALNYAIYNFSQQAELAREAGRERLAEDLQRVMLDLDGLMNSLATAKRARIGGTVNVNA